MSRIGKQTIEIPEKTEVSASDGVLTVKGPEGELARAFPDDIAINIEKDTITFTPRNNKPETAALWGTVASHVKNMVEGVTKPFEKKLSVEGVGFKADMKNDKLEMALGFSHPVVMDVPEGLLVKVEKNVITVSGIDKEKVGQFAASVRAKKKPEPYKGKGIRYEGEVVRRKEGKKTV